MKRITACVLAGIFLALVPTVSAPAQEYRRLSVKEYRDKMKAGWIGQIAGVSWGAPTEFAWRDRIMPENAMPRWTPSMINNAFGQDDLYVEMTFLRSLEEYGLDVSIRQAGIDFANSEYGLACANAAGRNNLRSGIAPPDSSHPRFNQCPNDIDYQIEADYSGLIAPGLPNMAIRLGEKFGRLMNYGDGVYGGQFMGGMYAEAFFETDLVKIVEAGLRCIPEKSQYAEMVRDMLRWFREDPDSWERAWGLAQKKYRQDPEYQKASNGGIDVKINGAYVLMGLLYGKGDLDQTIIISCRCGQDSDCNPSSSAGVLFTTLGFSRLPGRFTRELVETRKFSHTAYDIPGLLAICEKLARQAVVKAGGRIERDANGEDVLVIPVLPPRPSALELSWDPGPIANSRFSPEELEKFTCNKADPGLQRAVQSAVDRVAPGWKVENCGPDMSPGLREEFGGRRKVLVTHPLSQTIGCTLSRKLAIPAGKTTALRLVAGHDPQGDWRLIVKANGKELLVKAVDKKTARDGWLEASIDLTGFAGKDVMLQLVNQPSGWIFEAAYWAEISIESR